ncbi:MAG TPA: hypothetical protein VGJ93_10610 [Desulfuromonadaceae bacterium]|jgi:hypothetical protein
MPTFEFKRLKRTIIIYRTVQTVLVALLFFVALQFQHQFTLLGKSQQFTSSIITAVVIQLLLLYPIYRLAWRDAGVMIEGCATDLSKEQQAALRKKSLISDLWKFSGIAFYIAFVALAPDIRKASGAPLVLATIIFSFLITCLTYFQCFNFSAKKRMKSM